MKADNFSNNLFSNKVTENHINKFSRSEFLSTSNQFKNLINKSEEKNEEEKERYESKDVHQKHLAEKVKDQLSGNEDGLFSLFSLDTTINQKDLFKMSAAEMTKEDKNTKTKILENLGLAKENKDITSQIEKLIENKDLKYEDGKLKLEDNFKISDKLKPEEKIKIQEAIKNFDLKNGNKLDHEKLSAQKNKLGLSTFDKMSKNDFNLKNSLRSKSIEMKGQIGKHKVAKLYEQQQPIDSTKLDVKKSDNNQLTAGNAVKKVRAIKPANITKTNSDTLKNDFFSNQVDLDQGSDTSSDVQKGDFSKLINLKSDFKTSGVQDIVKQAQFLANNGGGEMKLLLNPKGLGALKLKVLMEENQLKVEMLTNNSEAKEIIESTLGELKKALGDNQLQVDSISVDSFDGLAEMLAEQEEQASKEFAQDFLSEFRQQNNEFRQGVLEFPVVKKRRSQIIEENTINVKSTNSDRRLDLVA